jgi:hypothetical protein
MQLSPLAPPLSFNSAKVRLNQCSKSRLCRTLMLGVILAANSPCWTYAQQPGPAQESTPAAQVPATASVSGIVLDINEAMVTDAHVTLTGKGNSVVRTTTSGSDGAFLFPDVPLGNYQITIASPGLQTFVSDEFNLHAEEKYQLPHIALPVTASFDVQVTVTEDQLAEEQVQLEIKQRTLGVFPNFYTSYIWNAAPLKAKHKFQLAIRSAIDPMTFVTTAAIAGEEQLRDKYPGYGDGAEGFGKRFGAAYGDVVIGRMIGGAILPSLFRQDPRYFYQGTGSVPSRAWHAITSAVVCRGDNGRLQPNYSHVLGNFAAGGISNLYRPDENRGVGLAVNNALLHTAANAASNLVREFILRGITTHVPSYAKGKPVK